MRTLFAWMIASVAVNGAAHDLITAESAQAYLGSVAVAQKIIASEAPPAVRARAQLDIGKTLDDIRDLLNRDLAAHGRVQGLPSSFLMSELKARGAELAFARVSNRFLANLQYYREALKLQPSGPLAAEASFRLVQGYFYDSFAADPLQPVAQTRAQLAEQIRLAEALLKMQVPDGEREETAFILAIHYLQAARSGTNAAEQASYASKARTLAAEFARSYPQSLRVATLSNLLDSLPAAR